MKFAFIVPRFGKNILGGAEALARQLAEQLVQQNHTVAVWTTCADDYTTWANNFPAGETTANGLTLHRFPISNFAPDTHQQTNRMLRQMSTANKEIQLKWLASGPHSLPLYKHIQAHAAQFDYLITMPYLSTIVQYAAWIAPDKTIIIPCMHDEPHAYMQPLHLLLEKVAGLLFLTPEEAHFTLNTLAVQPNHHEVIGAGVPAPPPSLPSVDLPKRPYLLCASRLEQDKNLGVLYEYTQRYVDEGGHLKLVLLGTGSFTPPDHPAFAWRGFVSNEKKIRLRPTCACFLSSIVE